MTEKMIDHCFDVYKNKQECLFPFSLTEHVIL